jgi:hypothetical protein
MLIGLGVLSFFYRRAAMFVAFTVLLLWSAVTNLWLPRAFLFLYAALEIVLAVWMVKKFREYRPGSEGDPAQYAPGNLGVSLEQ